MRLPRLSETAEDPGRAGIPSPRHRGRWLALCVLLVLAAVGVRVDSDSRAREAAAVGRCENGLRFATGYAERRLGLVANYLRPTLSSTGRIQQLHLADLMSTRAGRVLPRVQRADRDCRAVTVRPWHFSLVERQGAATAYSAALVTLVQTVAAQGRVRFRDGATLQRLRHEVGIGGG